MRLSLTLLLTALISFTFAQNPFLYNPGALTSLTAGSTFTISWAPSTGTQDTVTLLLRQGDPSSLITVLVIASNITNTGSYTWSIPPTLVNGPLYTFEIYDDLNHDLANYSNQFSIVSSNTVTNGVANPVATSTNAMGFLTTVYAVASATAGASETGKSGGSVTGTASSASASATGVKNGGVRVGGGLVGSVGLGMGMGALVGLVVL